MIFTVTLSEERARRLEELAREAGVAPEDLLRAGVEEWLSRPREDIARLRSTSSPGTQSSTGGWPDPQTVMFQSLKLNQAGEMVSATIPRDMAERLGLAPGGRILAVETEKGILLTPYDPNLERALAIASRAAGKYRKALRELAK